jgi:hypothetical protein
LLPLHRSPPPHPLSRSPPGGGPVISLSTPSIRDCCTTCKLYGTSSCTTGGEGCNNNCKACPNYYNKCPGCYAEVFA